MKRLFNFFLLLLAAGMLSGCIFFAWPDPRNVVHVPFNGTQTFQVLSYGIPQWYVDDILQEGETQQSFQYLPDTPEEQHIVKAVTRIWGKEFSSEWEVEILPCYDATWDGDYTVSTKDHIQALRGYRTLNGNLSIDTTLVPPGEADPGVSNLNGLECLETINGSLQIENNDHLADLLGLRFLTHVGGDLIVLNNGRLLNLDALNGLRDLGGGLQISSNFALWNINGLGRISGSLSHVSINYNLLLNEVSLPDVTHVADSFTISSNPWLSELNFSGLQSIGGCFEISNTFINSGLTLDLVFDFQSLTSVGEHMIFNDNFRDYVEGDAATVLVDFSNLTTIAGSLSIDRNHIFKSLGDTGLSGFAAFYESGGLIGGDLSIQNNRDLPQCRADEFEALPSLVVEGDIDVYPNNIDDPFACDEGI